MVKRNSILIATLVFSLLILLSTPKANAQTSLGGQRIAGMDRYETSVNISMTGWLVSSDYAVIATGENFPDALSAATLAKKYNAPILLTTPKTLDPGVEKELARLKVKYVYIIGGTGVISQNIQNLLESKGIKCTRLSGMDRYETSAAVANEIGTTNIKGTVVVTTGENFPDALSIAPWAASNGVPILLTDVDSLSPSILSYINKNNITNTYVIGGTGAVSDSVMSTLKNAKRIQGKDRYATNLAILNMFGSEFQFNKLYLATGNNFPDALSGSALAALTKSPIVLADVIPLQETKDYISSNISRLNDVFILGGQGVIPDSIVEVLVPPVVTNIEVIVPDSSVGMGKQSKATAKITMIPNNAVRPGVVFSVSDPSIAAISSDGTITGIMPGITKITASIAGKSGSLDIKVKLDKIIVLDPGHGGGSSGATGKLDGKTIYERDLNLQLVQKIMNKLKALGTNVILTRTGDSNVSLEDRAKLANTVNADLFISIHYDAGSDTSNGTSAYYSSFRTNLDNQDVFAKDYSFGKVCNADGSVIGYMIYGNEYPVIKETDGNIYILFNGKTGIVSLSDVIVCDRTPNLVAVRSQVLASMINNEISSLGIRSRGVTDNNFAVNRWTNMVSILLEIGFISNPDELRIISQDSFQELTANKIVHGIVEFYKNN